MKIGIDARLLGSRHGGIGRYVFELISHILKLDSSNRYVIFYNEKHSDPADIERLKSFQNAQLVSANIRHYSIGEQLSFYRLLNRHRLDLVHFPNFNVPLLYKGRFVVTIHDMVHHKISGAKKTHYFHYQAYKKIISHAAEKSGAIITVSEYSKNDIVKYLKQPAEKIHAIYEGVTLDPLVTEDLVEDVKRSFLLHRPYFLFVGVLERKKNIINLTRGFDVFLKKYGLDMDLVIAGRADKHYPEIKHKALDIKFRDRLIFTDYVSDAELSALYRGAYAYTSASLHEGFGLPGVEAMQFGLPLCVSNIEVFNEVYDNAAVYFDASNVEDIAEKMNLVAKDSAFYSQLQGHSLSRSGLFSWDKTARQTLEIYNKVLS